MIYFDHASAAPPLKETLEFYRATAADSFYNQEAGHAGGYRLRAEQEKLAAELSAAIFGDGKPRRAIWGNSATELFVLLADYLAGSTVFASQLEHPALLNNLSRTASEIIRLNCDKEGLVSPAAGNGRAVFCHSVQSELGVMQPLKQIFPAVNAPLRIIDAVQLAGKKTLDAHGGVTVISGVKFGSPSGATLLIDPGCPEEDNLLKFAEAYRHRDYRQGRVTFCTAAVLTFAAKLRHQRMSGDWKRVAELNRLLRTSCAVMGMTCTVPLEKASPYILHLRLKREPGAVVVRALSELGILAAAGSACAAESKAPSPAMLALGVPKNEAYNTLRLSFGFDTTLQETETLIETLKQVLENF